MLACVVLRNGVRGAGSVGEMTFKRFPQQRVFSKISPASSRGTHEDGEDKVHQQRGMRKCGLGKTGGVEPFLSSPQPG